MDGGDPPTTVEVGKDISLGVQATTTGGTKLPVSALAAWSSDNVRALTVKDGVAHGVAAGTVNVTASAYGVTTPPLKVTVTNPPLGALTVKATAREGGQTLTVTETVGSGMLRRYKLTAANQKPTVSYDTVCATADGWLDLPANGAVSGTEGQIATVVEQTTQGAKARKKGEAVLPAPTASA
ncbi:hypothetical protein [Bifidobacterium olomucense]|uniref:BIG2 domain-containing protein n=1 Tax=Bifidobacterium olomucense TaxID=2675324 RepID=A0A7Y0EXC8_9BIFI|nr:hypothetical protein [Bifidobacterium sp. DSM 109959]NMM98157.1 hypothetical protein [Bifidobacterium sp. DSM 109959]